MYKFRPHEGCRSCIDVGSLKTCLFRNSLLRAFFQFRLVSFPHVTHGGFGVILRQMPKYCLWDMSSLTSTDTIYEHIIVLFSFIHSWVNRSRHPWISEGKTLRKESVLEVLVCCILFWGTKMCSCCLLDLKWRWSGLSPGGLGIYHQNMFLLRNYLEIWLMFGIMSKKRHVVLQHTSCFI